MRWLVRLYPKGWRERYGPEIEALTEHRPVTVRSILDLLRGVIDAHLHPALAQDLVFVPTIGFRPAGTRVLSERATATDDHVHLTVLAVAAAPERTEMTLEWERTTDRPPFCEPGAIPLTLAAPPAVRKLTAALAVGDARLAASRMERSSYNSWGWEVRVMTFPPVPAGVREVALVVGDGLREWRVPFALARASGTAVHAEASAERHGITVRTTAIARLAGELVLGLEVEAGDPIRTVGDPVWTPPHLPGGRKFKIPADLRAQSDPIVLEDERGERHDETRRIFEHDRVAPSAGPPFVQRFSVVFGDVAEDISSAVLIVPFVDLNRREDSAAVDLRNAPCEVALGEYRFRIVSAEDLGVPERRVVLDVPPSTGSPRFIQPASVNGRGAGNYSWGRLSDSGNAVWMATEVGDPPIVRFHGAALRYDGPWRLNVALG